MTSRGRLIRGAAGYLRALAARARELFGEELVGAYAGGSWALGAYRPPSSDLDVALVVRAPLTARQRSATVEALRHEALPCPAACGLELVVYTEAVVRSATTEPAFELNLDTGAGLPLRVDEAPGEIAGHWFAIDRSILAEHGVALAGPPAPTVFASVPRAALLGVLAASVRWHRECQPDAADSLLNACRALLRVREGRWVSKPEGARWFLDYAGDLVGYG